jgi:hypothetical protein
MPKEKKQTPNMKGRWVLQHQSKVDTLGWYDIMHCRSLADARNTLITYMQGTDCKDKSILRIVAVYDFGVVKNARTFEKITNEPPEHVTKN